MTPLQFLKNAGAPDALVVLIAAILAVLAVSPWLGPAKIGGVELTNGSIPKWVGASSAVLFLALFAPVLPKKRLLSGAEREVGHRLAFIRLQLLESPLSLGAAHRAEDALDGDGAFRPAVAEYSGIALEPILMEIPEKATLAEGVRQLRRLLQQLPGAYRDIDPVDHVLARALREQIATLPE